MFNTTSRLALTHVLIAAVVLVGAATGEAHQVRRALGAASPECVNGVPAVYHEIEATELSDADVTDILFLREEEKLARDVYRTLAERWQLPIFANIAGAEQNHMDLVALLFETYEIEDPITDDSIGAFTDPVISDLFDSLVTAGSTSLIDALIVGATIEDMDLADLYGMIQSTANQHLKLIAFNLAKGTRNHLRAFVRALGAQQVIYAPQYLDQETFDEVIESARERQVVFDADGSAIPACGVGAQGWSWRRGGESGGDGGQSYGNDGSQGNGECTDEGPRGRGDGGHGDDEEEHGNGGGLGHGND
jgi:hypothetical protein